MAYPVVGMSVLLLFGFSFGFFIFDKVVIWLGRLTKEGLDYFSLDCKLDDKIYMVEVELGLEGFALFIKLLMKVYDEGYYLKWDDRTAKIFC